MANQEAVLTLHFLIEKRVSYVRKCLRLAQDRITTFLPNEQSTQKVHMHPPCQHFSHFTTPVTGAESCGVFLSTEVLKGTDIGW